VVKPSRKSDEQKGAAYSTGPIRTPTSSNGLYIPAERLREAEGINHRRAVGIYIVKRRRPSSRFENN